MSPARVTRLVAFLALGLHLLRALGQRGGLLADRVERDRLLGGLQRGIGGLDGDYRGFADFGVQRGIHRVVRAERDVARLQHRLDGGEVGAEHGTRLAVQLDGHIGGIAIHAAHAVTGGTTGDGQRVGGGVRGDLLRHGTSVGRVEAAGHDTAGGDQRQRCSHGADANPLTLVQRRKADAGLLAVIGHCTPQYSGIPRCRSHSQTAISLRRLEDKPQVGD